MQPRFLGITTMVALLISAICGDAKKEREEIRVLRHGRQHGRHNVDLSNLKTINVDRVLSDAAYSPADKLAQKFAKDALKSLKMQETINKLTNVDSSPNDLGKMSQFPVREHILRKSKMRSAHLKPTRHQNQTNKKRKRHRHKHRRKRFKQRQPRGSKKGPAKARLGSSKKHNLLKNKGIHAKGSINNSKQKINKVTRQNISRDNKFLNGNTSIVNRDDTEVDDYVDLTSSTIDGGTIFTNMDENESMVGKLMKTTTKDPKKKSPGDQGAEYSDYYNDIGSIDEGQALKEKGKTHHARTVRQSFAVPDENVENVHNFGYLDENSNDMFNLSQLGKEGYVSPKELGVKKSYNFMTAPIGQEQNLHPVKTEENFVKDVSNSAFSQLGQNERSQSVPVGQENSVNTDVNPIILQSNGNQYILPTETDDNNSYNYNYAFSSGQEEKRPVQDNPNYLTNYDTLLQKDDDKYIYPKVNNIPEDLTSNDQLQLPELNLNAANNPVREYNDSLPLDEISRYSNKIPTPEVIKNEENALDLKEPTYIYSEPYEKIFVLPQEQQQMRYVPMYKNIDQRNRLLPVNPSRISHKGHSKSLSKNTKGLLKKSSELSSGKHVQPVEGFFIPVDLESDGTGKNEDESNDLTKMKQQMIRRELEKRLAKSELSRRLEESPAEEEERLRREFTDRRNKDFIRNRHSVEEDVAKSQRVELQAAVNQTKEVADQILNKIVDELEEIKNGHSNDKNTEGLPCKLAGSWVTSKAGVRIDMKVMNHSIIVTLANLIPQPMYAGLLNTTGWNVTGHAPFKRGGPFSLYAYDNHTKTLAAFVGSCRVCQGVDTIEGVWSVAREPRDCRNFQMATEMFNDIFRRTKLLTAIKEKKKAILRSMLMGNATNVTTTYDIVHKSGNDEDD